MALDTFKARLKAKYPGVNLSQKRIDEISARLHKKFPELTEEADHDTQLDALNELFPFADLAKEDDRVRTLEAKNRQPQPPEPPKDPTPPTDDMPAWAKTLLGEVTALKAEKQQSSIKSKVVEKLEGKVPEKFYSKRALPEKEEELEQFIQEVESDWTELKQEHNNLALAGGTPASGNQQQKAETIDADIKAWAGKSE